MRLAVRPFTFPIGRGEARPAGRRHRAGWPAALRLGGGLLAVLALSAWLGPLLSPYSFDQMIPGERLLGPSLHHPFGTDEFGRDLLVRVLVGLRISGRISLMAVGLALLPGLALGLAAGYRGGWLDRVCSRLVDLWLSLPGLLLALLLVSRLGPSSGTVALALGVSGVPVFYRLARSQTMQLRQQAYIEAAVAVGLPEARILFRHLLPNLLPGMYALIALRLGTAVLAASGLSYIGLGSRPPEPELGALLASSLSYYDPNWWLAAFPGLAVMLVVLGFNFVGDGLRDRSYRRSTSG